MRALRFYSFQSEFKTNIPGPICCLSPFRNLFNTRYAADLFDDNEIETFLNGELTDDSGTRPGLRRSSLATLIAQ